MKNFRQRGITLECHNGESENSYSVYADYKLSITFNYDDIAKNEKYNDFEGMIDRLVESVNAKIIICSSIQYIDLKRVRENINEFDEIYIYKYNKANDVDVPNSIKDLDVTEEDSMSGQWKLNGVYFDKKKIDNVAEAEYIKMVFKDCAKELSLYDSVRTYVNCKAPYFAKIY